MSKKISSVIDVEWSKTSKICSVLGNDHNIYLFSDNGTELQSSIPKSGNIISMSWSFFRNTLVYSSSNGSVSFFNMNSQEIKVIQLKKIINKFLWNDFNENLCLFASNNEIIMINSIDFSILFTLKMPFTIEKAVFISENELIVNNDEGELFKIIKDFAPIHLTTILKPVHKLLLLRSFWNNGLNDLKLITISSDNIYTEFVLKENHKLLKINQIKLKNGNFSHITELDNGSIAYSIDDTIYIIRNQQNPKNEDKNKSINNYNSNTNSMNNKNSIELIVRRNDNISSFQFYKSTSKIVGLSSKGKLCLWQVNENSSSNDILSYSNDSNNKNNNNSVDNIQVIRKFDSRITNRDAVWSPISESVLTISEDNTFSISKIPKIRYVCTDHIELIQCDAQSCLVLSSKFTGGKNKIQTKMQIERIRLSANHFLIASRSACKIFNLKCELEGEFSIQTKLVEILGSRVFSLYGKTLEIQSFDGKIKNSIHIESKGNVIKSSLNGKYMAVLCSNNDIIIYDVSKLTPLQISKGSISEIIAKKERELNEKITIFSIGVSRGGFCVSFSPKTKTKLYPPFLFSPQFSKSLDVEKTTGKLIWDSETAYFFCIRSESTSTVVSYLIDSHLTLKKLRSLPLPSDRILLKVTVPRFIHTSLNVSQYSVSSQLFPFFTAIEEAQPNIKRMIVLLMFYFQNDDIDSAIQLIESITDKYALVTFLKENGKMNLLPQSVKESLSKFSDSKNMNNMMLFNMNNNNSNYNIQNSDKSIPFSEIMHDSLVDGNLSPIFSEVTNINSENRRWFGRFAEFKGDKNSALAHYSMENDLIDAVRFLCSENRLIEAKKLVLNSSDKSVICYFARFLTDFIEAKTNDSQIESKDFSQTLDWSDNNNNNNSFSNIYNANTTNNNNKDNKGKEIDINNLGFAYPSAYMIGDSAALKKDNNKASSSNDINFFSQKPNIERLIVDLYVSAERYGAAFEFAVQKKMFDDVIRLSNSAPKNLVCKAASYFEKHDINSTAINLYFRAGAIVKAVNMVKKSFSFEYLTLFQKNIQQSGNKEVIVQCAEYFESVKNYPTAVAFYGYARVIEKVQKLCVDHSLTLSNELVQYLAKPPNGEVAKLFEQQGQYVSAAKIYLKLNMKIDALKTLMKLNDIDRVVKFTNLIKIPSCYELTADYISTVCQQKSSSPLFHTVVSFYQKSDNLEKIASYYEKTARVEIETSQNYERALELLNKSQQILARIDHLPQKYEIIEKILQKIRWIEMYIEATKTANQEMMKTLCHALLMTQGVSEIVRNEDIVFLLVQNLVSDEDFKGAQKLLENLRQKGADLEQFMERDSIKRIYRAAGCQNLLDFSDELSDVGDDIADPLSDDF